MACCGLEVEPALYTGLCLEVCPQVALAGVTKQGPAHLVPADPCMASLLFLPCKAVGVSLAQPGEDEVQNQPVTLHLVPVLWQCSKSDST